MNNITVTKPAEMVQMATSIAKSNLFGFKSMEQAYAILMLSEASGKHPMALVQDYHIINNRPALKSGAVMSRFMNSGGSLKWIRLDDEVAEATFIHPKGGELTMKWTIEKAKKAGIYDSNPVWKKYPSNMLRSRLFSDAVSALYPACLDGAMTQSQAEDIPAEEIEECVVTEVVEDNTNELKLILSNKLKGLTYDNSMIKGFAEFSNAKDKEILEKLVSDEDYFNEILEKFEDGE